MRALPGAEPFSATLAARLARATAAAGGNGQGQPDAYVNRLILERSPYLRQHARNPVNWYAWGDEAFAEASRLQRPVFLSIGYSTCHWCHVMEEESFSDEEIAALLNGSYVAIKVDREERPDVDAVYMRAAMAMNGGGGWPLSVWLTEAREPFFSGTYFPPRHGMRGVAMGFLEILAELARVHREEGPRVREVARSLVDVLQSSRDDGEGRSEEKPLAVVEREGPALVAAAVDGCRRAFDEEHGGLRFSQKFPSHVPVRLLLRHHQRTGDTDALRMAVRTLEAMAAGGIYDQLAGGFHRYATDVAWRVPHFEKMLYDNALLIVAYAEAWQVTRQPRFARIVAETCDELLATFAAPEGGFFSATDADAEGEEGKYFAWSQAEIRAVLGGSDDTEAFLRYFDVTAAGQFELGNVLAEARPDEETRSRLQPMRAKLLAARRRRVPPFRDEKILAAWNGLAISAFAVAGRTLGEPRFVAAAVRAADFVLRLMRLPEGGMLSRSYYRGQMGGPGFLEDHAFVTAGLLDLCESTGDPRWFTEAYGLAELTERQFADDRLGGWFTTGQAHERLIARERPLFDGAEPAGSSVALMNAARLAVFTGEPRWREVAGRALALLWPRLEAQPMSLTEALLAVDFLAGPVHEIVLACPSGGGARELQRTLGERFCPRKVLVVGEPGSAAWTKLGERIPLIRDKGVRDQRATAYVCAGQTCLEPTGDPEVLARQLVESQTVSP
jgi:uncharacterized protein